LKNRGEKKFLDESLLKDPIQFAKELIAFKQETDDILKNAFDNNMAFQKARDQSFMAFMNKSEMTAKHLATYADHELTVGLKGASEEEIGRKLSSIVSVFCLCHSRDIFMKEYGILIGERLLNRTFLAKELEARMLDKLKIECGVGPISKMTKMFTDIDLSVELAKDYKNKFPAQSINLEMQIVSL